MFRYGKSSAGDTQTQIPFLRDPVHGPLLRVRTAPDHPQRGIPSRRNNCRLRNRHFVPPTWCPSESGRGLRLRLRHNSLVTKVSLGDKGQLGNVESSRKREKNQQGEVGEDSKSPTPPSKLLVLPGPVPPVSVLVEVRGPSRLREARSPRNDTLSLWYPRTRT